MDQSLKSLRQYTIADFFTAKSLKIYPLRLFTIGWISRLLHLIYISINSFRFPTILSLDCWCV